jgi:hypothetical protein
MVEDDRFTALLVDERNPVFSLVHARSGAAFD